MTLDHHDEATAREAWRPVVGSGGLYEVSNLGNVRSFARSPAPKLMTPHMDRGGYPLVCLSLDGRQITPRVHTLVMAVFVGPRPTGQEVRHLDGDQTNNRLSNLAYGTKSENQRDSIAHGTNHALRKTHCPAGHPFDAVNTLIETWKGSPKRHCRTCRAARERARRARRKAMSA